LREKIWLLLLVICIALAGCGEGSDTPLAPKNIATVPSPQSDSFTLTWDEPTDWGPGTDHCYRIEFFDGEQWVYVDTITDTSYTYEFPPASSRGNRFSVRAETELGHSQWMVTNSFMVVDLHGELLWIETNVEELSGEASNFFMAVHVADELAEEVVIWTVDVPWMSLPAESEPSEEILVDVEANESEEPREATITAQVGEASATLVLQQGVFTDVEDEDEGDQSLTLSPREVSLDETTATSFEIVASGFDGMARWSTDVNWLSVRDHSEAGVPVIVEVTENFGDTQRTGVITVTAGGQQRSISVKQVGPKGPEAPAGVENVPLSLEPGRYVFSWTATEDWGTGWGRQYRVEFYDGRNWNLVGQTEDTEMPTDIPELETSKARFRVRTETAHGNSQYVRTNSFAIEVEKPDSGEDEHDPGEDDPREGRLTMVPRDMHYEDGNLVVEARIGNEYGLSVTDLSALVTIDGSDGQVAQEEFSLDIVIGAGETENWTFVFSGVEADVDLEQVSVGYKFEHSFVE